jgi:hypothetical protein
MELGGNRMVIPGSIRPDWGIATAELPDGWLTPDDADDTDEGKILFVQKPHVRTTDHGEDIFSARFVVNGQVMVRASRCL